MRVNLSVAIVAMVNNTAIPHDNVTSSDSCPNLEHNSTSQKDKDDGPFAWDESQQGTILGCIIVLSELKDMKYYIRNVLLWIYLDPGSRRKTFGSIWREMAIWKW